MSFKSEEFEKWRQEMNIGEENSPRILSQQRREGVLLTSTASSIISEKENMSTATASSLIQGTSTSFHTTLTKESPRQIYDDSDDATYDSYHCRETDYCRDSTDVSDSGSSFDAIMEVIEYEVASNSENEALYSNDSSSGTDDFFFTAVATTAAAICQSNNYFADTENSNSSSSYDDPELSLADYWKCVKCKNKQNNPMFRYCEKCYQIRKSHFPPRPRKGNLKRKHNSSPNFAGAITALNSQSSELGNGQPSSTNSNTTTTTTNTINTDTAVHQQENRSEEIAIRLTSGGSGSGNDFERFDKSHSQSNNSKFQIDSSGRKNKYKKRKFSRSTLNSSSERNNSNYNNNNNSHSCGSTTEMSSSDNNCCSTDSSDTDIEYTRNSRGTRKRKMSKGKGSSSFSNSNNKNKGSNGSGSDSIVKKRKLSSKSSEDEGKMLSTTTARANDKSVNISEIKVFSRAIINKFSDSEMTNGGGIVGVLPSPSSSCVQTYKIDSGISSAPPSSQEMPGSSSSISDDPSILSNKNRYFKHNKNDDDGSSSDTICGELDDKDVDELQKTYSNGILTQHTNNASSAESRHVVERQEVNNKIHRFTSISKSNSSYVFPNIVSTSSSSSSLVKRSASAENCEISLQNFNIKKQTTSTITLPSSTNNNNNNSNDNNLSSSSKKVENPTNTIDNMSSATDSDQCVICFSEPKNGAFIHTKCAHLCCCYKCAVKIWNTRKKCPICNGSVKNVLKLFVH